MITIIIDTLIKIVFRYVAYGGTAYMEICSKLTGLEIFCSVATDWNSSKRKFPFYYCTFNISTYLLVIRSLSSTRTSSSNLMIAESMFTTPSSTCLRFICWLAWSTSSRITRTTKSKLENWWWLLHSWISSNSNIQNEVLSASAVCPNFSLISVCQN